MQTAFMRRACAAFGGAFTAETQRRGDAGKYFDLK